MAVIPLTYLLNHFDLAEWQLLYSVTWCLGYEYSIPQLSDGLGGCSFYILHPHTPHDNSSFAEFYGLPHCVFQFAYNQIPVVARFANW
jgi:hypothetical protein